MVGSATTSALIDVAELLLDKPKRADAVLDRVFTGLDAAQEAHDYMESNANVGKIVVDLE